MPWPVLREVAVGIGEDFVLVFTPGVSSLRAYRTGQEDQLGAFGLVLNSAVLWATGYLHVAVDHLGPCRPRSGEHDVLDEDVARVSPLKQATLNCVGVQPRRPPVTRGPAPTA
ncbi:Tn3 family transposase [Streptomyces sp. NBC_01431]|uniref:Tn3 family transposase n=1 Tax=Streptomyces sp. NBC_01431 TaxID=2903863 RepID=UPI003FCDAB20